MSQVITCPKCDKKLALRDELKGRALICPQCKGRFTAPADGPQPATDGFGATSGEAHSPGGSAMAFLDNLAPATGLVTAKTVAKTLAPARASAGGGGPAASAATRVAAGRAKQKEDQTMMIYIGTGIAVTVLVVILIAAALMKKDPTSSGGGGKKNTIRFNMTDSSRHQLFNELFTAVDQYGISKECKEEWFRLADSYKLDRKNIKDILAEGFDREDWSQPPPAHVTNKTRGTRMDWIGKRHNGSDPILAQ